MHASRFLSLFCAAFSFCALSVSQAEDAIQTLVIKGDKLDGPFSEQKPDFLHFREVVVTRESPQRLKFDITLSGDIPSTLKDNISFYFGFDIDNNDSTGTVFVHVPNAGFDMGFSIYRAKNTGLFKIQTYAADVKGRKRDIDVSGLKVRGNKIELMARSELFRMYDSLKFYINSSVEYFDKGKKVNEVDVDGIPVTSF